MKRERKETKGVFERPKKSGHWWIRYADEFGQERREAIGPHGLASKMYHVRKAEVAERRHLPRASRAKAVLMREAIAAHVKRQTAALRSTADLARYGRIWSAELGSKPLRAVTPADIEAYLNRRRPEVSQQTLAHEVAFLRRLFNLARRDGLADTNPAQGLALLAPVVSDFFLRRKRRHSSRSSIRRLNSLSVSRSIPACAAESSLRCAGSTWTSS